MPLVRSCRNRHCPEYAGPDGWCDTHRRAPFWSSPPLPADWGKVRAAQLAAFPFCRDCGATATEAHHVRGRQSGELASLCAHCHSVITHREAAWLSHP